MLVPISSLLLAAALAAHALPSPLQNTPYHIHEARAAPPQAWQAHPHRPHPSTPLPLRIALAQSNLAAGADALLSGVADPDSPLYAKHWTPAQVAEFFAPKKETVDAVLAWLAGEGVDRGRLQVSASRGWVGVANATVGEAERLLRAEYALYVHAPSGTPHLACTSYSLPAHLTHLVDFITPTVHFDAKIKHERIAPPELEERASPEPETRSLGVKVGLSVSLGLPSSPSLPKLGAVAITVLEVIVGVVGGILGGILGSSSPDLSHCADQTTLSCLRALYDIPLAGQQLATGKNSLGVVEFTPQSYVPADLDTFFAKFEPGAVGTRPTLDGIDGGVLETADTGFGYNGESNLDLEYAMALVSPLKPVLYQVGDPIQSGSFNNFLDAIDASYCTYDGGDDPTFDSIYPSPYSGPGAYEYPEQCGAFAATNVISVSYSYDEPSLTPAYEQRQCNEYMKLGLQGVTLFFSSGDAGVASGEFTCTDPATGEQTQDGTRFVPSFPAGCPYITSVGATQLPPGSSVFAQEVACETFIYSGGGFSDVFALPSYQSSAVGTYYASYAPSYSSAQYNDSRNARGFPDISANGANFVVAVQGNFSLVYGTSASTPVVASIFTLVNDKRLAVGKGPVGFVNPALYKNPWLMNDITSGSNPGCGTDGFSAVPGWDPVTGLGTPNYNSLVAYFLTLP